MIVNDNFYTSKKGRQKEKRLKEKMEYSQIRALGQEGKASKLGNMKYMGPMGNVYRKGKLYLIIENITNL